MMTKKLKPKKCRYSKCRKPFTPKFSSTQVTCFNAECAYGYEQEKKANKEKKQHQKAKRKFRLSDLPLQKKLAQATFNKYIRLRDEGQPCIACSRHHQGQIHASHYRSTGSQPQLRFHEDNCHAGCQPCNTHLSGNLISYRINLVKKIGLEQVEFLEKEHPPKKYTIQDYIDITEEYKLKIKELMVK